MSAELETLDQLAGGDLRLTIVRQFYSDDDAFTQGVLGLLSCGDARMLGTDGAEVPDWRWQELFGNNRVLTQLDTFVLTITEQGAKKV
jgi:hypothetical protein